MINLTKEQLTEIADQLDCGFSCHINKQNGEILFIPNSDNNPEWDLDVWQDDIDKIDEDTDLYITLNPPSSRESFQIMSQFVGGLQDNTMLKIRLIQELEKRHPFREFKLVIDNSGEYRRKWFAFKSETIKEYVENEFRYLADEN